MFYDDSDDDDDKDAVETFLYPSRIVLINRIKVIYALEYLLHRDCML